VGEKQWGPNRRGRCRGGRVRRRESDRAESEGKMWRGQTLVLCLYDILVIFTHLIKISRRNWDVYATSCADFSAHFQMARGRGGGGGPLIRMAKD
jgi:hypothetical protein